MKKSFLSIGLLLAVVLGVSSCSSEESVVKESVVRKERTADMLEFETALKSYAKEKNALRIAKGDTATLDANMAKVSEKFLLISGYKESDIQNKEGSGSTAVISMALKAYAQQTAISK
ncbi:hypothetical protein [Flavobacterium sp.]|uniref:hypothetical protein n=1 Tax=Flavobacterium sp. TaxID=239 RepID=UPI0026322492|nr:hypothetical protein [Flavobacterium sp.]